MIPTIAELKIAVKENIAIGTQVGTIEVLDVGSSPITSFTLDDTTTFDIDINGAITTKVLLDYTKQDIYKLTVVATNDTGDSEPVDVGIMLEYVEQITHLVYILNDGNINGTESKDIRVRPANQAMNPHNLEDVLLEPLTDALLVELKNVHTEWEWDSINSKLIRRDAAIVKAEKDAKILEEAKAIKLKQINDDYELAEKQNVDYIGNTYYGGADSVRSIDGYVRLNRLAGLTSHTIWDINGQDTALNDAEADGLILAIGQQSSTNRFTKKNRKTALANATIVADVEAI